MNFIKQYGPVFAVITVGVIIGAAISNTIYRKVIS